MRILHVIARLDPGGAERLLLDLVARGGHEHEFTVVSGGGAWVERLTESGATHVTVAGGGPDAAPPLVATARTVRRVVRSWRPDVVHTANIRMTAAASAGVRLSGRRPAFLTTAHGTAPEQRATAARVLRIASPVVVGCAPVVSDTFEAAGFPADRLRTIPNAAALDPPDEERVATMRRRLGVDDRPLVVGIGRLVPAKNWGLLIDAFDGLDHGRVDVVIAGDGPLRAELQQRASASSSPVRLVGYVDDVPALLAAATCVVSTSAHEGLPIALLETLSLGVPVVATDVYGATDRLDGTVLVAPGDAAAIRTEVLRMLDDGDHRGAVAAAARQGAGSWTPAAMVDAYHELYASLVS